MKVTIYALHLGFGGVEKYVATIANILVKEHDVEIISTYRTTSEPAFFIDENVKIVYLLPDLLPNNEAFKNAVKNKKISSILKEGIYAAKVLYLRHKRNKESIKNCTSDVVMSTRIFHNNLISKYASSECIKITGEHNHPHGNEKYINRVIASCKEFDYFIPISKALCELYDEKLNSYGVTTKYIPFCIEPSKIESHQFPSRLTLINVGRLSHEKGIFDLIQIVDRLVHKEHLDVLLHLIGNGELEKEIKEFINSLNLSENIIMHGFQNKEFIYEKYKESLLYVMTSFTESFGIVLLEAMSCGLPCLAFDSAEGSREIISDGIDGFLISKRDMDEMVLKIKGLASQPQTLERLSDGAFTKAKDYSFENCAEHWLSFFQELDCKM